MADFLRRYTDRRSGVPWVRTTVRIWGEQQIATFEAMCEATARSPHELAGDIVVGEMWEAGPDPAMGRLARKDRKWRIGRVTGRGRT